MNRTHFEHAGIALFLTAVVGLLTNNWWAGAALSAGVFLGREHAQAEYRWIETFGSHRRAYLPWWGGFDRRVWTHIDSWFDWIIPALLASLVALIIWLD